MCDFIKINDIQKKRRPFVLNNLLNKLHILNNPFQQEFSNFQTSSCVSRLLPIITTRNKENPNFICRTFYFTLL